MVFLMFSVGPDRYVLDAGQVEQVLPLMAAKALPGAPRGVAGVINYHGEAVALIDISQLFTGREAAAVMSTRIILARYALPQGGQRRLALCAERVERTLRRAPGDFVATAVDAGTPDYLGPVATDEQGVIQWVRAESLMSEELRNVLFQSAEAGPGLEASAT